MARPDLNDQLSSDTFRQYYYLKAELTAFCREQGLPTSGGKLELTERVAHYLATGQTLKASPRKASEKAAAPLSENTKIEPNFRCTERHRQFFTTQIGPGFTFNVSFQKWLRENPGKTYQEAIVAYGQIIAARKKGKTDIGRQFEYNTYIREFFADNQGKSLEEAIKCWRYKKSLPGHNRYEPTDLEALK